MSNLPVSPRLTQGPSLDKGITKIINLQNLVEHPQSLKLLILHTPYPPQISTLWKCTNLIKLDLSKNNLDKFPFIGNLYNLKFMFIHNNKLDFQQLKGIFFAQDQLSYSPLSKSIQWVTFFGNRNSFLARHFLINSTSVIAIDNHMIVQQQRKTSIDIQCYQNDRNNVFPFDQITDISSILKKQIALNKNATEEEYMQQFWEEIKILRKKMEIITPVIKVQKVYRGWIIRKKIKDKQNQMIYSFKLKFNVLKAWILQKNRNKKLTEILTLKNKQHLLLPLKQMKVEQIRRRIFEWAARAKKKVLIRRLSLVSEVRFFGILKSNVLMFKSIYDCLQIQKSKFLLIDSESFKLKQKILRRIVREFHGEQTFTVQSNTRYIVRQAVEGNIKKEYPRLISLNQRSYMIRLFRQSVLNSKATKYFHRSICNLPAHVTGLKSIYSGLNKVHLNTKQKKQSINLMIQINNTQQMMLKEYLVLRCQNKRILKDLVRCVYFINIGVFNNEQNINVSINPTNENNYMKKVQIFSEKSANKLAAVTYVQNFWRGYATRKKQKQLVQLNLKQRRAIIKLQRWIRNLPARKRTSFRRESSYILKSINDRFFYIQTNDYLNCIERSEYNSVPSRNRLKFIQQNLMPYVDFNNKRIMVYWNGEDENLSENWKETVRLFQIVKKIPFDSMFVNQVFKNSSFAETFFRINDSQLGEQLQKAEMSHLFHFNTWVSLMKKEKKTYIKVSCNNLEETKLRVLGILLRNYTFLKGFSVKIYGSEYFEALNQINFKSIVNKQSVFITKGNIQLKQNNQKIQKFMFKAKMYLNEQLNVKPRRIQQNLVIFIPVLIVNEKAGQIKLLNDLRQKKSISFIQKQKTKLTIDQYRLSYLDDHQKKSRQKSIKRRHHSTIRESDSNQLKPIKKQDLLPQALKRILPTKKQIKSYKFEKRIKVKQHQQSFILDNVSKNQRFMTQPDEITRNNNQNSSILQKPSSSHLQYSTVRDKIRKQYLTRKDLIKNQKSESSFYQNFTNINNFIQQQQLFQQVRRIKTEHQIQSYESANHIRVSMDRSSDKIIKSKQLKLVQVEKVAKQHKQKIEKTKKQMEKQNQDLQRARSVQRQKQAQKQQVKRLKVSFAEQCFPLINRSYNEVGTDQENDKSKIKKWTQINTQYDQI